MFAATPLRRHLLEPWFVPIARGGAVSGDEHVLKSDKELGDWDDAPPFSTTFHVEETGRMFFYVNDAVLGFFPWQFYKNNYSEGTTVHITPLTKNGKLIPVLGS